MEKSKQTGIISVVRDYGSRLFDFIRSRVTSREDAEDILQDVWYQVSNVDIETIDSMSGWLHRVARNKLTDRYRKEKDTISTSNSGEEDNWLENMLASMDNSPESNQFREIFWEELMAALEELPEKQREVFVMNEMEDMTLQEIADAKGENLKTIISRKGYAVKHLRSRLIDLYNELNSL